MKTSSQITISTLLTLGNGIKIPIYGLGTYKTIQSLVPAVKKAHDIGIKHFDTAAFYQNEKQLGEAIRDLKLNREELFITSKVWPDDHGYDNTIRAFETTLEKLNMDYIDLYLVHWPGTTK
jgi:diketogulonate reductase-like aldo/keto reductase